MEVDTDMKFSKEVNGNERGFSMVELIIAVGIAGIMMAIALPKLYQPYNSPISISRIF